jgi:DNA-binding response OmpR family regulator
MSTESAKKVLIIEDEQDLREALKTVISYENFETHSAGDGEEGLRLALEIKPDLILLDLMMPKLDGLGVLRALREDPWGKNVKVIVMTALDDLEKVAEVVEFGGTEYIVKSNISLGAVVAKVKEKLKD